MDVKANELIVRLDMADGSTTHFRRGFVTGEILRGLALGVNGEDIVRLPFYAHPEDGDRLHTICSRIGPEIVPVRVRTWGRML